MGDERDKKWKWLAAYEAVIRKRLSGCKKQPSWEHFPAGHMYMGMGLTPQAAAKRYLAETVWTRRCKTPRSR